MIFKNFNNLDDTSKIAVSIRAFPDIEYPNHDFLELVYVISGRAQCTIDDKHHNLSKGDYFMVDYKQKRDYKQIGNAPFTVYSCIFSSRFFDHALQHAHRFEDVVNSFLINLNYEWLQNDPYRRIFHDDNNHILQLFLHLFLL